MTRAVLAIGVLVAAGCASQAPVTAARPDPDAEARAAARAFLQCAERAGAECRPEGAPYDAWAAAQLLARLREGLPTTLLRRLDEWLRATRDPTPVRRAFVQALAALEPMLRGGGCAEASVQPLLPGGLAALGRAALSRAQDLGLLGGAPGGELAGLPALARPMDGARVVEVACGRGRFFLLLAATEGGFQAVAAGVEPPRLGGPPSSGPAVALPVPAGVVSPFLPVAEEAL